MNISEFHRKIKEIEDEYDKNIHPLLETLKKNSRELEGVKAIIPCGRYRKRIGKITSVSLFDGKVSGIIQPYYLRRGEIYENSLLWDRADARTYWELSKVEKLMEN